MRKSGVTIKDVAREAKVSVATVSRALNGHENVAEAVRRHVVATAERLRYTPHAAARSLSSRSTQTIGVVLPELHGEFFSELIRGIEIAARAQDWHLLVSSYHGAQAEQGRALRSMRGRVDGLLVLSPYADQPGFLADHLPPLLPTVLINTRLDESEPYSVLNIDNHAGAVVMAEHLVKAGHRDIAFICGPDANYDARERLRGFREVIARHAAVGVRGRELEGDFTEASGFRAGQKLLASGALPDAVFAANDMMALGCLFAFNQAGKHVPGDVALAGFDDIPLARLVDPPLTTMRVNIAELGEQAMRRLLRQIETESGEGERRSTTPELIVRASSRNDRPPVS